MNCNQSSLRTIKYMLSLTLVLSSGAAFATTIDYVNQSSASGQSEYSLTYDSVTYVFDGGGMGRLTSLIRA